MCFSPAVLLLHTTESKNFVLISGFLGRRDALGQYNPLDLALPIVKAMVLQIKDALFHHDFFMKILIVGIGLAGGPVQGNGGNRQSAPGRRHDESAPIIAPAPVCQPQCTVRQQITGEKPVFREMQAGPLRLVPRFSEPTYSAAFRLPLRTFPARLFTS